MKKVKLFFIAATLYFLLLPSISLASQILFAHVDGDGIYVDDGNRIRDMLISAGHTVTTRFLDVAVYNDYSDFDQIFVYDLYTGADNDFNQTANYTNIATWYNNLSDQNIILDGRIISSDWASPSETAWIQNYATQLDLRGGGLVLGTDHATAFTEGINDINTLIGINPFTGFYNTPPLVATVDSNSPLYLAAFPTINDNSSTSFVPTGLQSNGQTLTPVAFHGTTSEAWDFAAVSSTIGSITFGTSEVPEPTTILLFGIGLLGLTGINRKRNT